MIERIKMPVMVSIARTDVLSRGEWEKLSRLCATIEMDGAKHLRGSWEGRRLFKTTLAVNLKAHKIREEIETYIRKAFKEEGLALQEWVIHAHLDPNVLDPTSLAEWKVRLWCLRKEKPGVDVEHTPTISERVEKTCKLLHPWGSEAGTCECAGPSACPHASATKGEPLEPPPGGSHEEGGEDRESLPQPEVSEVPEGAGEARTTKGGA